MDVCDFCEVYQSNSTQIIRQSDNAFVLLSNPRLTEGHTLVIPKRHTLYPGELTSKELMEIFALIEEVRCGLLKHFGGGVDIRQHYRPFLPQGRLKVDHVHFHVLPRHLNDKIHQQSMQYETGLFSDLSEEERRKFTDLLRQ